MAFENNEVRQFPTKENFLGDKRVDDRIYGYMQENSYLTKEKVRYCWKIDMSAKKIKEGLIKSFEAAKKNKEVKDKVDESRKVIKKKVPSEATIRNGLALLGENGLKLIKEDTISNRKVYILTDLSSGEYVFIKTRTLQFLINSSNSNTIKVYAFLKRKYELHKKSNQEEQYRFSESQLLKILGYNISEMKNHAMIQDILDSLKNNGLIETHLYPVEVVEGKKVYYIFLDKVNEDYTSMFNRKNKADVSLPVPVPDEPEINEEEMKNATTLEEFMIQERW